MWQPAEGDDYGPDQKRLVEFCLQNNVSCLNPKRISWLIENVGFARSYTPSQFQHKLLVPLRNDPMVFIGTGGGGVFLITGPDDADATLGFYSNRVRAEQRHARNLRKLAQRTRLFEGYASKAASPQKAKQRTLIFVDESGSPNIHDLNPDVFVVSAVLIESMQEASVLEQRFANASAIIKKPVTEELKASSLSAAKHRQVLRELSLIDYQWAAACFVKSELIGQGFASPKSFYKYAFQFLVSELLAVAWQAELVLDEYSNQPFQQELETYLRRANSGLPVGRLDKVTFGKSSQDRLVQLADLVAGAVRRSRQGEPGPLRQIEEKRLNLQFWPPRSD